MLNTRWTTVVDTDLGRQLTVGYEVAEFNGLEVALAPVFEDSLNIFPGGVYVGAMGCMGWTGMVWRRHPGMWAASMDGVLICAAQPDRNAAITKLVELFQEPPYVGAHP